MDIRLPSDLQQFLLMPLFLPLVRLLGTSTAPEVVHTPPQQRCTGRAAPQTRGPGVDDFGTAGRRWRPSLCALWHHSQHSTTRSCILKPGTARHGLTRCSHS